MAQSLTLGFYPTAPAGAFRGCDSEATGDIISLVGLRGELKSFLSSWLTGWVGLGFRVEGFRGLGDLGVWDFGVQRFLFGL